MEYSYVVTGPEGDVVLQASESCRYPRITELSLMAAGYTIRLDGKKIGKKAGRDLLGGME